MTIKAGIPENAKRIPLRPLALGEVTGHHHSLMADPGVVLDEVAEMFETTDENGTTVWLQVTGDGVRLVHQEHKAHLVPPGTYRLVLQRENTDWGSRQVID